MFEDIDRVFPTAKGSLEQEFRREDLRRIRCGRFRLGDQAGCPLERGPLLGQQSRHPCLRGNRSRIQSERLLEQTACDRIANIATRLVHDRAGTQDEIERRRTAWRRPAARGSAELFDAERLGQLARDAVHPAL